MYPSIAIAFSISPATMVGKLFIPNKQIMDRYNAPEIATGKYDAGKDFMEGVLTQNYLMVGTRWFNLPTTDKIIKEFENYFGINRINNLELNQKEIKVPTKIADSPLTCVAEGTGIILDNLS